jgi:hypothetical protein
MNPVVAARPGKRAVLSDVRYSGRSVTVNFKVRLSDGTRTLEQRGFKQG